MEDSEPRLCHGCGQYGELYDFPFHNWACRLVYLMGLEYFAHNRNFTANPLRHPELIEEIRLFERDPGVRHKKATSCNITGALGARGFLV